MRLTLNKFAYWALLAWGSVNCLRLVSDQLPLLNLRESIGYGDSYILDTVENFRRTGVLYPPLGPNHLVPAIYSPLLYGTLALAQTVARSENPYFGPRILELFWFLACAGASGLLAQRLVPGRRVLVGAVFLALSFWTMTAWVMQLRGDFPGICCSLLALYFLLSGKPSGLVWAGVCAGFAMQFKLTFVTAAVAGGLWLIVHRRWLDLLRFTLATGISSAGLYAVAAWREPQMLQHIFAMRQIIPHPAGVRVFSSRLLLEPVFWLAMIGFLPLLARIFTRRKPRWQLLLIFFILSLGVSLATVVQAGASMNYFYEPMFASIPFAVLSLLERRNKPWRGARMLAGILLLILAAPYFAYTAGDMKQRDFEVAQTNQTYQNLGAALDGAKVFSTIPDIARLRPDPAVMEPLLLNYLVLTRGADLSSLVARLERREFHVVVTSPVDDAWRGVPYLARELRGAIIEAYEPHCLLGGRLYLFPKNTEVAGSDLAQRLMKLGCKPGTCPPGLKCPDMNTKYDQFLGGPPTY